ncbi:unnamed protein product [Phytomonas sp. Hart1]|nr:unnamed protein product [Phytomonas sp. Hart1]|eukprot:CCW72244.1 unnamed protein product [Phytomonas sp. isolate Hart1]
MRVLHKLRGMDDVQLNRRLERILVGITRVMTVTEFAETLLSTLTRLLLRRSAGQIAIPSASFAPRPLTTLCLALSRKYSLLFNSRANPCGRPSRPNAWPNARDGRRFLISTGASLRGFCQLPTIFTEDSFCELFEPLVAFLSSPSFVDMSASTIYTLCGGCHQLAQGIEEVNDDAIYLDFHDGKLHIWTRAEKVYEDDCRRREALADRLLRRAPGKRPQRADTGRGKLQTTSQSCVNKRRRNRRSSGCA